MESLKWEKINLGTHLTNEMTSFHVDTRFFYYMYTTHKLERIDNTDNDVYYDKFNDLYDKINGDEEIDEKYLIDVNSIIPFVISLREMKGLNRLVILNFNVDNCKWWVKYLRFYRYKGDKFIVTNDCTPIEWKELTAKTINVV